MQQENIEEPMPVAEPPGSHHSPRGELLLAGNRSARAFTEKVIHIHYIRPVGDLYYRLDGEWES